MNKTVQRLLLFFIGVPLILSLVFLKYKNHLALQFLILFFAFFSSAEMYNIQCAKIKMMKKGFIIAISLVSPIVAFFCAFFSLDFIYVSYSTIFSFLAIIFYEVLTAKTFEDSNKRIAAGFLTVFYSGVLITYVTRLTVLEHSIQFITFFLLMIFICDSSAWFFGILFGKNNRGFIAASPNKSIAGFVGAILSCIALGLLIKYFLWPDIFSGSPLKMILLSILMALSGIIGDLVESVFKRSANVKDSGKIIMGRGGALDSIDSILASAPVFYVSIKLLYSI